MKHKIYILLLLSFLPLGLFAQFESQIVISTDAEGPEDIVAGDIDGDGDMDVLVASRLDSTISWFENTDGLGNFSTQNIVANLDQTMYAVLADLDGDTDLDVLATSFASALVVWYENTDGLGSFGAEQIINPNLFNVFYAIAADIDGDGDNDVLASSDGNDTIVLHRNLDGLGTFDTGETIITSGTSGTQFTFADIDGDDDIDIVSTSSGSESLTWYENTDGEGTFSAPNIINPSILAYVQAFIADIDGDEDLDILVCSAGQDTVAWFENLDGLGNFGGEQIITTQADFARDVFAADADNDGDIDVFSASALDDTIAWYENIDGLGTFSERKIISTEADSARALFVTDLDGDNFVDVLSGSLLDDKTAWYRSSTVFGVEENSFFNVSIYPNPVSEQLFIKTSQPLYKAKVFSHTGQLLYEQSLLVANSINTDKLSQGVYFITVEEVEGKSVTKKFIKK